MARLQRGDLLPRILQPPPGPRSRQLSRRSARYESPGINALGPEGTTVVWQEARGANVTDVDGNRYLDLTAGFGVAAVGHRHPAVAAAVRRQAGLLLHGLGDVHSHANRAELARLEGLGLTPATDPSVPIDGDGPTIWFQKSETATSSRNRVHLDIRTTGRKALVDRVIALGGRVRDEHDGYTVMLDPEGNQFCIADA